MLPPMLPMEHSFVSPITVFLFLEESPMHRNASNAGIGSLIWGLLVISLALQIQGSVHGIVLFYSPWMMT